MGTTLWGFGGALFVKKQTNRQMLWVFPTHHYSVCLCELLPIMGMLIIGLCSAQWCLSCSLATTYSVSQCGAVRRQLVRRIHMWTPPWRLELVLDDRKVLWSKRGTGMLTALLLGLNWWSLEVWSLVYQSRTLGHKIASILWHFLRLLWKHFTKNLGEGQSF